jgi:hypothetical protein
MKLSTLTYIIAALASFAIGIFLIGAKKPTPKSTSAPTEDCLKLLEAAADELQVPGNERFAIAQTIRYLLCKERENLK